MSELVQSDTLLTVDGLQVKFATEQGVVSPVRDVSFTLKRHETLGIIGESGCGKSVTAQALMGLLPPRYSRVSGAMTFNGQVLRSLTPAALQRWRGSRLAMIFQDPLSSLNPVFSVAFQIEESLRLHTALTRRQRRAEVLSLLHQVGIDDARRCAAAYPHEISGGMRQRVMIAMAIASRPALLIADEPTTALDVTIQAQILALLEKVKADSGMGIILISHDLSVVAQLCQRVLVMYLGEVVEEAEVVSLFDDPLHPYTRALLQAVPRLDGARKTDLPEIRGTVPALSVFIPGCGFADRCPYAQARCREQPPVLRALADPTHRVRCWRAEEIGGLP
ncbi:MULTISPECIES: ABC transporter ATP-binding protein [Brenneria]|uniref:ABC-type dipeptide transporter n=1 Tax=Brenneria nigrifluens DSM 30175 = ATCC 13028 TaxID=1121120 RepID=A0A2U1UR78_9GAMM|nr:MULTISPECIES: ABC transporter ATP-binding protein [Brenneria]EHD22350.1 oligopeptide/dipeptide ABC transporter, ATPase subunit [Brenneria sp. EniD312]PWC24170.1 ABC transporter ATP-binding protein [Brenneria nigrifluens DSM 30175 = ATCC 13028]QCR05363.1 ABC transporter ATP-binding protein [Brenneria nigrifluens DSM 30175 = ATCC 13028]